MITRVGILDGLTPAVAAWLKDLNPASARALLKAGRLIRKAAVRNVGTTFRRTGQARTSTRTFKDEHGGRQRVKIATRGIRLKLDQAAGLRVVRVWHGSGILAAHELGSTIPATTLRAVRRRILGWGGTAKKREHFAPMVTRRAFTLPRRPTLTPAYLATASEIPKLLEAEYAKVLALAPPAVRS